MRFFVGIHHPADAQRLDAVFVSVNSLRGRKSDMKVKGEWILDSGAFTEISTHGHWRSPVSAYAAQIRRWKVCGQLLAAVAQDYMCEPYILTKTGLTVGDHQRLTIARYDALLAEQTGVYVMPVLQGWHAADYAAHVRAYGTRLAPGAWVGVGSVCKRNRDAQAIEAVLLAIKRERPDLRLHGFGVKLTSLASPLVRDLLETADSMAWSYSARKQGRNQHDWREAKRWVDNLEGRPVQRAWSFIE